MSGKGSRSIDGTRAGSDGSAGGYVEFHAVGEAAKGDVPLPPCPMCGGTSWERRPWFPFTRADRDPRSLPPIV